MSTQPVNKTNINVNKITTISQIDVQISDLYKELEVITVQPNPDLTKQQKILDNIKQLQELKMTLYNEIGDEYRLNQKNVVETRDNLVNDTAMANILNAEMTNIDDTLTGLKNTKNEKIRMTEINNYYSSKYDSQTQIMKTIVYFCVPILILGILIKKEFIPQSIGLILITILAIIGIVIVALELFDNMNRDNMVYDEYNWNFDPKNVDIKSNMNGDQPQVSSDSTHTCVGQACCPPGNNSGIVWNDTTKLCTTQKSSATKEEFVAGHLLKNIYNPASSEINIFKNTSSVDGINSSVTSQYSNF
jgi:hypothetical protein